MKSVILLFVGCWSLSSAQSPILGIDRPNPVFLGFNNKLSIGTTDGRPFIAEPVGAKLEQEGAMYILHPQRTRDVFIVLKDPATHVPFDTINFVVCYLPSPELYYGASRTGENAHRYASVFNARYGPEIPLSINHEIVSLEVYFGDRVYHISGNQLTEEVLNEIRKQPNGASFNCLANVRTNGWIYKISGKWKLI